MNFLTELINQCENYYEEQVKKAAETAVNEKRHIILVTGASSCGKTTTAKKICGYIEKAGLTPVCISFDDFYRNPSDMGNIEYDFESPYALDVDLLHDSLLDILSGNPVDIPAFDFQNRKRIEKARHIDTDENTYIVFEGLHAHNPLFIGGIKKELMYKVYLSCHSQNYNAKLLRRMVRDYYFRNAKPEFTMKLWKNVVDGEKLYIRPYKNSSNIVIQTFLKYEPCVLKNDGLYLFGKIESHPEYGKAACRMLRFLEKCEELPKNTVPDSSVLHEFIG